MRVVVVGAGIVGASTAYHLSRLGADVVVVDQGHPGKATAAGAGIVCPWATSSEDPVFYGLYASGGDYYPALIAQLSELGLTGVGYGRVGAILLAGDDELPEVERRVETRVAGSAEAGELVALAPSEARSLFPPLRADLGGLLVTGGARVDGAALAGALAVAAKGDGAELRKGHAELVVADDRTQGIRVEGELIEADAVVVAAGSWVDENLGPLGYDLGIEPQKGQIVHLGLPGVDTSSWPVVLPIGPHYLVAFEDSRVAVGATRETGSGFDLRVTAGGVAKMLEFGLGVAPGLVEAVVLETRVGLRPMSGTGLPVIGPLPGTEGLYVANGLGAAGLTIGPLAGRLIAQKVTGDTTDLDLSPFVPKGYSRSG